MQIPLRALMPDPATASGKRWARGFRRPLLPTLIVISALIPSIVWAQASGSSITQIRGHVKLLPPAPILQGIPVTLDDERGSTVARTQTDSRGMFLLTVNNQGQYTIRVSYAGYREVTQRVSASGFVSDLLIILKSDTISEAAQSEFEKGSKLLLEGKDPRASLTHLQKAAEIHPAFAEAYLLLGRAYMDLAKWKEAQSALQKAIEKNDKMGGAHLALGACFNQQKDFVAAEKALLRGLELSAESAEGHYELGRTYWALGRWQDAEPPARKALELEPGFAAVHVLLGNILLRKRDARGALQQFNEYLKLDPQGPFAPAAREMVAKIEKALASQD